MNSHTVAQFIQQIITSIIVKAISNCISLQQNQEIVFIKNKSISFNEKIDVLFIPTRLEMSQKFKLINIKRVHFNRKVIVFHIPSRKILQRIAQDLWYSSDELAIIGEDLQTDESISY